MKYHCTFFAKQIASLLLLLMVCSGCLFAQSTITCGTGTTSSYTSPFCNLYKNSWHEMIYLPSELQAAQGCSITKIAFQSASTSTISASTIKIYMGERTSSNHASTSDWTPMANLTLVYSGTNVTVGTGSSGTWQTFNLTTPYDYSGLNPLVVVVTKTDDEYVSACTWYYSTVTDVTSPGLYRQNDSDASYGTTHPGSNSGSTYGYRANTRFTYGSCCSQHRTGNFAFSQTDVHHVIGQTFAHPTLTNTLTPSGTVTYYSSNPAVATVNATTGAVTFTGAEGSVTITARIEGSGNYCPNSTSYTIRVDDGCTLVGDATSTLTTGTGPLYGLFKQSYNQIIYTPAEVGSSGHITGVGWNASASNSQARTIDIYMGETTQSEFNASSTTDWIASGQLQLVYSATNWTVAQGWNIFPVDFQYSGLSNLVIAIDCGAPSYSSTSFYYTATTGITMKYAYSDTYDAVPATITSYQGSTSANTYRPNTKICIEPCAIQPDFEFANTIGMCYLGGACGLPLTNTSTATPTFSSSDPTVASIDPATGEITSLSLGSTIITAEIEVDGEYCPAQASYELQVICPAQIPSAHSVNVCGPQQVTLTADNNGGGDLQWFNAVDATTPVATGGSYTFNATTTTTYYVGTLNTTYNCSSSRVPATVNVFETSYAPEALNIEGMVGVTMYGYPPTGSHAGATFTATGMPAWLTLNADGSFSGTPTTTGSGTFTITATSPDGCTTTTTIHWTVTANTLSCCDPEAFYIFQSGKPFPLQIAADGYYYADVCLGDTRTLSVTPLANCTGYTYTWRLASNTGGILVEQNGTSFSYTYDRAMGYNLTLTVRKTSSPTCSVAIPVRIRVAGLFQVATRPSFDLCAGEPFNIYVSSDGIGSVDIVRPNGGSTTTLGVTDTVLLPDGAPCNGDCFYRSTVTFTDFANGSTIRNANDLLYVMLNIEHTFIGDIYIAITCPNGSRSVILSQSGNGSAECHNAIPTGYDSWDASVTNAGTSTDFGEPNSGNSSSCDPTASGNEPGVGWNYIWSENTTRGYTYAGGTRSLIYESVNVGNDRSSTVDSSHYETMEQIYRPQETFNRLIGCPLNGDWSIEVVDGWGGDNGHIFAWELGLNEELLPDSWQYSVDVDSAWVGCDWNMTKAGVYMEITPPADFVGTTTCDLFLRDEYGCVSEYDNIVTVTMHDSEHSTEYVTGQCEPYTWPLNGQTYTEPGTYVENQLTSVGCPIRDTLVLEMAGVVYDTVREQACQSFTWNTNHQTYTSSTTVSATLQSAAGCDSIVTLVLEIRPQLTTTKDTSVCPITYPFTWYGVNFTGPGTNTRTLQTVGGCDSIVTLTVNSYTEPAVTLTLPATACPLQAGSYSIPATVTGGTAPYTYTWSGDYTGSAATATIPASGTCEDYTLSLLVTDAHGCRGTVSGSFSSVDNVDPSFTNVVTTAAALLTGGDCEYAVPDVIAMLVPTDNCGIRTVEQAPPASLIITGPRTVDVTITDVCGRTATASVNITVPQTITADISHTDVPCTGNISGSVTLSNIAGGSAPYTFLWSNGSTSQNLTGLAAGTYTVTITDANGCTLQKTATVVTLGTPTSSVYPATGCDSYTWPLTGQTFNQSNNTATYTTLNTSGCDSTVTLNLVLGHSNTATVPIDACETYTWPLNGQTYTASASPVVHLTNVSNCDSAVTLQLTIHHNEFTSMSATACDTYTWSTNNSTYLNSGTYTHQYTFGLCVHVDTLHLTVNRSNTGVDQQVACNSYTWPLNNRTYVSSTNSPAVVLIGANQVGCDSTVTLHLTIHTNSQGTDVQQACDTYTWPVNGQTYTNSTTSPIAPAGQNVFGCDSTVRLNLTIFRSSSTILPITSCDSYYWNATGQTYYQSGPTNSITFPNAHGCDSTVRLNLTINQTHYSEFTDTVCNGSQYRFGNTTYPAGDHTITLATTTGCDSVITLHVISRPQITIALTEEHSCELGHYVVTATVTNGTDYRWSSSPNDPALNSQQGNSSISVNPDQTTLYTLTAGFGRSLMCAVANNIRLTPLQLPHAEFSFVPDHLDCDNLHWRTVDASSNASTWGWYVDGIYTTASEYAEGDANCADDSVVVVLEVANGICTDTVSHVIYVKKSGLYVPNVFTPTLHSNKIFNAQGSGLLDYEMYVYTREGLMVYHTTSLEGGWDGTHNGVECQQATYTYVIRYRTEVEPEVWQKKVGTVFLMH